MKKFSNWNRTLTQKIALIVASTLSAYVMDSQANSLLTISSTQTASSPQTIQSQGLLGGNLNESTDWDHTHPFVDLMKQARLFGSVNAPWDETAVLGSDGWPVGDFGVTLMTDQSAVSGISGVYKFSFTGQATVSTVATPARIQNVTYDNVLNQTVGEINFPAGAGQLYMAFQNTNGGIKNLKVIHPGYSLSNTPVFRAEFLNHIKRAKMLRFMDWTKTNGNTITSWSGRVNAATTHNGHFGVAWEDIIELANETTTPIWINIPAQADDDYVLKLATLINTTINPGIPVYIEYSNELWNYSFQQFTYNAAAAKAEVAANPSSPLNYDKGGDDYGFRRTAYRLKQISDIFRTVVGDTKMMSIYRPILAGQIVQPSILAAGLGMIQANFGAPKQYFYGLAGAVYFNLGSIATQEGSSVTTVLNALEQSANTIPIVAVYEKNIATSSWYGLKFLGYETGDDTFGPGSLDAKAAANNDPRMQTICENFLTTWYQAGFDTTNWYTFGAGSWSNQYGTWPLTYDLNVNTSKIACLDSTNAKTVPSITMRHMVPGSWDAREQPNQSLPFNTTLLRSVHQPQYVEFMFYVTTSGSYSLVLKGGAANSTNGSNTINIALNNKIVYSSFQMTVVDNDASLQQTPIRMQLKKGVNVLHFSSAKLFDSWYLSEISIK